MKEREFISRIVIDPTIMAGKPVIRGTRLTVPFIIGLLAQGMTTQDIVKEYKNLAQEDILACLLFAHEALTDTTTYKSR